MIPVMPIIGPLVNRMGCSSVRNAFGWLDLPWGNLQCKAFILSAGKLTPLRPQLAFQAESATLAVNSLSNYARLKVVCLSIAVTHFVSKMFVLSILELK